MGVRGARREVDHEVVEIAPLHVTQELLDRPTDERAAPHDRLTLGHEELDRDDLDAVALEWGDLIVRAGLRLTLDAHHQGDIRTGDVGIEQANRCTRLGQRDSQVHAHRALAHAALAGDHRNNVLDPRQELLGLGRIRSADHRPPGDLDRFGTDRPERRPGVALDLVLEWAGRRGQLDRERDPASVNHNVLDHVQGFDVTSELRFLDGSERRVNRILGEYAHELDSSGAV
jgi:hypothetical protein